MTEDLKKRLIGAAVLASLAVIFVPMLLEKDTVIDSSIYTSNIPEHKPENFKKPVISEAQLQQRKEEFAFGTTIKPDADTEVKEVITAGPDDAAGDDSGAVSTRVGLTSWMIQVGSFSSRENARKVVEQLRQAGYDTHLETAQVKTKQVHRVRVGPEVDRNNADKMAKDISKKFFLTARVIRYP